MDGPHTAPHRREAGQAIEMLVDLPVAAVSQCLELLDRNGTEVIGHGRNRQAGVGSQGGQRGWRAAYFLPPLGSKGRRSPELAVAVTVCWLACWSRIA